MKRKLLLGLGLLLSAGLVKAQFSPYNRVINVKLDTTATYSYATTQTGTSYLDSKPAVSATQFFPYPTSYTARALFAASATTDGQFSLGSGVLSMKNPGSTLIKSSFYNIQNATGVAKFAFDLDLTNYAGAASFVIYFGNDDGGGTARLISASSGYAAANADIFGSFRIVTSGAAVVTQYRDAAGANSVALTAANSLIKVGVSQHVEIFANSTSNSTSYTHVSSANPITLAANTYHVYVNNVKYSVDFPRNGLTYAQTALDGLTFEFNNHATQETISISNLSITYQSATDPTLPVSLTSFTGKKANSGITLNWSTASEQNNDYFEVARSTDGKVFTTIGTVKGKETTNEASNYLLTDYSPISGINYYQLKQVDKDGTATVFKDLVSVNYALGEDKFTVYANEGRLNISTYAEVEGLATLSIFDLQGKKIISTTVRLSVGQNILTVDANKIGSGIYVANLVSSKAVKSAKFTKR